jgi:hypothetical protein
MLRFLLLRRRCWPPLLLMWQRSICHGQLPLLLRGLLRRLLLQLAITGRVFADDCKHLLLRLLLLLFLLPPQAVPHAAAAHNRALPPRPAPGPLAWRPLLDAAAAILQQLRRVAALRAHHLLALLAFLALCCC